MVHVIREGATSRVEGAGFIHIVSPGDVPFNYKNTVLAPIPPIVSSALSAFSFDCAPYQTAQGTGPLTWSIRGAPSQFTIDTATGRLVAPAGMEMGATDVFVAVYGKTGVTAETVVSITVHTSTVLAAIPPIVGSSNGAMLFECAPYQTASNAGALTWALIGAPANLTINPATGTLYVAPGSAVNATVRIVVKGFDGQEASREVSVVVYVSAVLGAIPAITGNSGAAELFDCVPYQTATDTGPLTWSLVGAPSNLTINAETGRLLVTVGSAVSATTVRVQVRGFDGVVAERSVLVTVYANASLDTIPPVRFPQASAFAFNCGPYQTATGTGPLSWSLEGAPANLTIDATTGVLSVPVNTMVYANVTVRVQGTSGVASTQLVLVDVFTFYGFTFTLKPGAVDATANAGTYLIDPRKVNNKCIYINAAKSRFLAASTTGDDDLSPAWVVTSTTSYLDYILTNQGKFGGFAIVRDRTPLVNWTDYIVTMIPAP
jgi:hypothetical protein